METEYQLIDPLTGKSLGVIDEISREDSADPDYVRYVVYVKAGTAEGDNDHE